MFSTISGIIVMAVVACLMSAASRKFGEKFKFRITQALTCGIACGLVTALSPKVSPWVAMFFLIAILILMIYIVFWWKINGSTVRELIIVSLLDLMVMLTGQSAAARILDITSIRGIVGLIKVLPIMAFILSVGFFITNMIYFREWIQSEEFDPELYLENEEEVEEFETDESIFTKIRRWVLDEEDNTSIYLSNTRSHCTDC